MQFPWELPHWQEFLLKFMADEECARGWDSGQIAKNANSWLFLVISVFWKATSAGVKAPLSLAEKNKECLSVGPKKFYRRHLKQDIWSSQEFLRCLEAVVPACFLLLKFWIPFSPPLVFYFCSLCAFIFFSTSVQSNKLSSSASSWKHLTGQMVSNIKSLLFGHAPLLCLL